MSDFERLYLNLERLGPGSDADTRHALSYLSDRPPTRILDIGCGTGPATRVLLRETRAQVVALDNFQPNLDALHAALRADPATLRLTTCAANMAAIPYPDASFDWLWAEGSAYVMGFTQALRDWKRLLAANGRLIISDLVWRGTAPPDPARAYWLEAYPDMMPAATRRQQISDAGYTLLADFELSPSAWEGYYRPLQERLAADPELAATEAGQAVAAEIAAWRRDRMELAYTCFIAAS